MNSKTVATKFLNAFDAVNLTGRKKNLVRSGDAYLFFIKNYMYTNSTLMDIASKFNEDFKKYEKRYSHSDVIHSFKRHHDRMSPMKGVCDRFYMEVYDKVINELCKEIKREIEYEENEKRLSCFF
jgi:hypothetical protein